MTPHKRGRIQGMNRPVRPDRVTVSLSPEAAAPLAERVASGEFASLDEATEAALRELQDRQAAEALGEDDEAIRKLIEEAEADNDPAHDVDAVGYLKEMLVDLRSRIAAQGE